MSQKVTQLVAMALVAIRKKKKLVKPQHWHILIVWKTIFAVMIVWGADVSSSHKEYQNILKDYQQNLVIYSCIGVEITWNFV